MHRHGDFLHILLSFTNMAVLSSRALAACEARHSSPSLRAFFVVLQLGVKVALSYHAGTLSKVLNMLTCFASPSSVT